MWAEMLCRKASLIKEGLFNGHNDAVMTMGGRTKFIIGIIITYLNLIHLNFFAHEYSSMFCEHDVPFML